MLINLSNHPYPEKWQPSQIKEAKKQFGEIINMGFPKIKPTDSYKKVVKEAEKKTQECEKILNQYKSEKNAIHVMGEMTFVFQFVKKMAEEGILCVASTTDRITQDLVDGSIRKEFEFIQFRPYTTDLF